MKDLRRLLTRPVITEKTTRLKEKGNVVSFAASGKANKGEIKRAVEEIFDVKVDAVRTLNIAGKRKRAGKKIGKRSNWKKVYVTLSQGETIDIFEGV